MAGILNIFRGDRPDITAAQIFGALLVAVGPILQLAGIPLEGVKADAVDDLKVIGLGLMGSDAALRIGRNIKQGKVEAAALTASAPAAAAPAPAPSPAAEVGGGLVEVPLDPMEIDALNGDLGADYAEDPDVATDDLDDEALAIAEEELAHVPAEDTA